MNANATNSELDTPQAWWILGVSTFAFTVCFAAWMMNGVLAAHLLDNALVNWTPAQLGWVMGVPVLTGSLLRLPLGVATDRWGGRLLFSGLLFASSVPMYLVSACSVFWQFVLTGLGFGIAGASFSIGVAYVSLWFSKHRQGTALGIFGAGNAGAALSSLLAPQLLNWMTAGGANPEGWRHLPRLYAACLGVTGLLFVLTTTTRLPAGSAPKTLLQRLTPLKVLRVWRFGLYYLFTFGGFVALAQWLVPYYVSSYAMPVATAGALAACNSLPAGIVRAAGGWVADRVGARTVMYWVFGVALLCSLLLTVPQMEIRSPGAGVMAGFAGTVVAVTSDSVQLESPHGKRVDYQLRAATGPLVTEAERRSRLLILPRSNSWQEAVVQPGQKVEKRQLLAIGQTQIFFQANVWIFTGLTLVLGIAMGMGSAAVYKHIPEYFPHDVGVVGGIVGVLGGLGGFLGPVVFGALLSRTGLWTSCWMLFLLLIVVCLVWMHLVIQRMLRAEVPRLMQQIDVVR